MNARLQEAVPQTPPQVAVVVLGVGQVGGALLQLLGSVYGAPLRLCGIADSSRQWLDADGLETQALHAATARAALHRYGSARDDAALLHALERQPLAQRVIVDCSADAALAARHVQWLVRGVHVISANKAALGGSMALWQALQQARSRGSARYGDAACVGAGLPVLSSVRRLHAAGDAPVRIEGVFSGSLSWLFNDWDGSTSFAARLRAAQAQGYTEPDPRADLGGEDVARKLLALVRAAGHTLERTQIAVDTLVPASLRSLPLAAFLQQADALDTVLAPWLARARASGGVLRHLACFDAASGQARVGLAVVPRDHPAAALQATDNLFVLHGARDAARPLQIQGAGAGALPTAQALLADLLELC